jgi:NADH-quinone oxidoreductase subunit C
MNNEDLKNKILAIAPDAEVLEGKQYLEINIVPEKLRELSLKLKESEDTHFDYLFCQTGVDWKDSLGVIYHLASTKHNNSVVLKTKTADRENPSIPTVSDIWRTAEYHEREIYDMLGIRFKNHPDMRRFFLDESWSGYPQRKDYVDEENIIER